jgi:nitric oxide reductase subunit C
MKRIIYITLLIVFISLLTACAEATPPVVSKYDSMIATGKLPQGNAETGKTLFNERIMGNSGVAGCVACHTAEAGVTIVGPSQVGLATLANQSFTSPDYHGKATNIEGFLLESIVAPSNHVAPGYPNVMYRDYGAILSEQELADLVAYLTTLK